MYLSYLRSLLKYDWIRHGVFEVAEQLSLNTFFNKLLHDIFGLRGVFLASKSLNDLWGQKESCPCLSFEKLQWNKFFNRTRGLTVNRAISPSGLSWIINKIILSITTEISKFQKWSKLQTWVFHSNRSTLMNSREYWISLFWFSIT